MGQTRFICFVLCMRVCVCVVFFLDGTHGCIPTGIGNPWLLAVGVIITAAWLMQILEPFNHFSLFVNNIYFFPFTSNTVHPTQSQSLFLTNTTILLAPPSPPHPQVIKDRLHLPQLEGCMNHVREENMLSELRSEVSGGMGDLEVVLWCRRGKGNKIGENTKQNFL